MQSTRKQRSECGQGYWAFYLIDCHGEYQCPESRGISIRQEWSGYDYEDLFNQAGIEDSEELLKKAFNKRFNGIMDWDGIDDISSGDDVVVITIWDEWEKKKDPKTIERYADLFEAEVRDAISTASGDDSYYDYMPSFVDMFRQFCQLAGFVERYNNLALWIDENEEDYNYYGPSRI